MSERTAAVRRAIAKGGILVWVLAAIVLALLLGSVTFTKRIHLFRRQIGRASCRERV